MRNNRENTDVRKNIKLFNTCYSVMDVGWQIMTLLVCNMFKRMDSQIIIITVLSTAFDTIIFINISTQF